jgi:hypothetical protein
MAKEETTACFREGFERSFAIERSEIETHLTK